MPVNKIKLLEELERRGSITDNEKSLLNNLRSQGQQQQKASRNQYVNLKNSTPAPRSDVMAFEGAYNKYSGSPTPDGSNIPRMVKDVGYGIGQILARPYDYVTGDNASQHIDQKIADFDAMKQGYNKTQGKVSLDPFSGGEQNEYGFPAASGPAQALSGIGDVAEDIAVTLANPVGGATKVAGAAKAALSSKSSAALKNRLLDRLKSIGTGTAIGEATTPTVLKEGENLGAEKLKGAAISAAAGETLGLGVKYGLKGKQALSEWRNPLAPIEGNINNAAEKSLVNTVRDNPELIDKLPDAKARFAQAQQKAIPLGAGESFGGQLSNEAAAFATNNRQFAADAAQEFDDKAIEALYGAKGKISNVSADNVEIGELIRENARKRIARLENQAQRDAYPFYEKGKNTIQSTDLSKPLDAIDEADYSITGGYTPDRLIDIAQGKIKAGGVNKSDNYQRKIIQDFIYNDGIDPSSDFAKELNGNGVTPSSAPALFKRGGRRNFDNIPMSEYEGFDGLVDDGKGYIDQNSLIERMINETFPDRRQSFSDNNAKKEARDIIKNLGLEPDFVTPEQVAEIVKKQTVQNKLPSSDPQYLDNISDDFTSDVKAESRPFRDEEVLKTIDNTDLLKSQTYKNIVDDVQQDLPDTFERNGPANSVGNILLTRHYLQEEIRKIKDLPNYNKTKVAELQDVVEQINGIVKKDDDLAFGDQIYQDMYAERDRLSRYKLQQIASSPDATIGGLSKRLMTDAVRPAEFKEIIQGLSTTQKRQIAAEHFGDTLDSIKNQEAAYSGLYNKLLGSKNSQRKFKMLLDGGSLSDSDKFKQFEETLSVLKGATNRKFLKGGSNTKDKFEAEAVRAGKDGAGALSSALSGNYRNAIIAAFRPIFESKIAKKLGANAGDTERMNFDLLVDPNGANRAFELIELSKALKNKKKKQTPNQQYRDVGRSYLSNKIIDDNESIEEQSRRAKRAKRIYLQKKLLEQGGTNGF